MPVVRFALLTCVTVLSSLRGQQAGLGQPFGLRVDVETRITAFLGSAMSWGKCVACARDRHGNYWIAAGHPGWTEAAPIPGKLVKLDPQGVVLRVVDQPPTADTSFGIRDLAYDGLDTLYGGLENLASNSRLYAFDLASESFRSDSGWRSPRIPGQGTNVVRGLAYDPLGNQGLGTMWACDFGPQLVEFDRGGAILRTLVIPGLNPLPYGLALDPERRTLWLFGWGDSTRQESRVVGIEIDLASGQRTGSMFLGDPAIPSLGGFAGGCEFYVRNQQPTLLLLAQADRDTVYEIGGRLQYGTSCGGRIAMTGDAPYAGNPAWSLTLQASGSLIGIPLLSGLPGSIALPTPLFAAGCTLLVDITVPPVILPPVVIQGGFAGLNIPIPPGLPGSTLCFQWVELSSQLAPPLRASDGAAVFIGS